MSQELWSLVDQYFVDKFIPSDPVLDRVLENNNAAGLPPIDVSATQGKFLYILALIKGARRILEIGTLGAYSTIWMARALPQDGKIITLEVSPQHAEIASTNLRLAGVEHLVEVRLGKALDSLAQLETEACDPFDLIFIDADKANNAEYLRWAMTFSKPGTVIIGDNVVRSGGIVNQVRTDGNIKGIRDFITLQASDPRLCATALQTVGSKGYDGFSIAVVV